MTSIVQLFLVLRKFRQLFLERRIKVVLKEFGLKIQFTPQQYKKKKDSISTGFSATDRVSLPLHGLFSNKNIGWSI